MKRIYADSPHVAMLGRLPVCVSIGINEFRTRFMAVQSSGSGPLQMGRRGPGIAAVQGLLNALLMPSPGLVTTMCSV